MMLIDSISASTGFPNIIPKSRMPLRQNVLRTNITEKKYHRRKGHLVKITQDKTPPSQNTTGQNVTSAKSHSLAKCYKTKYISN